MHQHLDSHDTDRERLELELLVARCQLGEPAAFDVVLDFEPRQ